MEHYILKIVKTKKDFKKLIDEAFPKKYCSRCHRYLNLGTFRKEDYSLRDTCRECTDTINAEKELKRKNK